MFYFRSCIIKYYTNFINLKKKEGKAMPITLEVLKKDVDRPLIAILNT